MKKIEKLFLTGCGYTVLILTLFYIFAAITEFTAPAIAPLQFALIVLFGLIIAAAELLYEVLNVKRALKCLIHYAVLLLAFCIIFIISGNIASSVPAVFVSIVIFTMLYFSIWLIVRLVRKTINAADNKLESASKNPKKPSKTPYKPLYKDNEK